ncbi:MAG TPA: YigZ family protein [Bacteroidales bacterium]|nr:YigZ family protein [Bacteroidales bacterium]HPT11314.1 YigZ family protein [Bacteroidales bacterium]
MLFGDTYKTITSESSGLFKDRGSRFIAIAVPVKTQEEIKSKLEALRKEYHDARHHCYAWVLSPDRQQWRANDDGEPSGTAGKPILGQINSNELTDILVVVIRYFGGTLLGVSGLINAYRTAASDAIANAMIVEKTVKCVYKIEFPYLSMNDVMKVLKEEATGQSNHNYGDMCSIEISFRQASSEKIIDRLSKVEGLKSQYLRTE